MLRLLLGQAGDYSGSILFDGSDIRSFDSASLSRYIGYINQNVFLFHTTIRDNITLGDEIDDAALQRALEESALADDVRGMPQGLETPVGENGNCLSGGQRQRVAIARAFLHHRSILFMDEGTSALDQKNAVLIQERLLANPDITLILVSHHLEEVGINRFDRVYRLE